MLMETTVTLLWLASDLEGRVPRCLLSDAVRRVEWDDAYAQASGGDRLLSPASREELVNKIAAWKAEGVKELPPVRQLCDELDPAWHPLAYRQGSQGATHATPYALERFIAEETPAGCTIDATGPRTRDDTYPYETAALWLHMALDVPAMSGRFPWSREDLAPTLESILAGMSRRQP
jgi:hypothetical protein